MNFVCQIICCLRIKTRALKREKMPLEPEIFRYRAYGTRPGFSINIGILGICLGPPLFRGPPIWKKIILN